MNILLVDHLLIQREAFKRALAHALQDRPYQLFFAENKDETLRAIDESKIQWVFIELHLPEEDGFVIASKIFQKHEKVPCVLLSELLKTGDEYWAKRLGFAGCLSRPIRERALKNLLLGDSGEGL